MTIIADFSGSAQTASDNATVIEGEATEIGEAAAIEDKAEDIAPSSQPVRQLQKRTRKR